MRALQPPLLRAAVRIAASGGFDEVAQLRRAMGMARLQIIFYAAAAILTGALEFARPSSYSPMRFYPLIMSALGVLQVATYFVYRRKLAKRLRAA